MTVYRRVVPVAVLAALAAGTVFAAPAVVRELDVRFPHEKHATLFPLCTTCHAGVVEPALALWPEPAACGSCHDGVIEPRVEWAPRTGARARLNP